MTARGATQSMVADALGIEEASSTLGDIEIDTGSVARGAQ